MHVKRYSTDTALVNIHTINILYIYKQKDQKPFVCREILERRVKLQAAPWQINSWLATSVLRFLLAKKLVSVKTAHALYRGNGPLIIFFI